MSSSRGEGPGEGTARSPGLKPPLANSLVAGEKARGRVLQVTLAASVFPELQSSKREGPFEGTARDPTSTARHSVVVTVEIARDVVMNISQGVCYFLFMVSGGRDHWIGDGT